MPADKYLVSQYPSILLPLPILQVAIFEFICVRLMCYINVNNNNIEYNK